MPSRRVLLLAPSVLVLSLLRASVAEAAWFAEDGTFVFDANAAVRIDLEDDSFVEESGLVPTEDPGALSGKRVLSLGNFQGFDFTVTLPKEVATYRASFWARGGAIIGSFTVAYSDRGTDEVAAFYPTGRMTSDGWVELANEGIRVDGTRAVKLQIGGFSPAGGAVDAFELTKDGGPWTTGEPNAPCEGSVDLATCAEGQICLYSTCRNVNAWVPPIPADRQDVAAYLANRAERLFGPYLERTVDLPAARASFESMGTATHPWAFWNGFLTGIRRLHDGHTTTSGLADFVLFNPHPIAVCFLEGDADLSQGTAPKDPLYLDVVVSHTGGDHHLGLHPGDRLVRVDGQHPIAWARSLVDFHWSLPPTSNHRTHAELASSLHRFIARFAHEIEVIRCDAATGTCGATETISIADLPLEAEGSPIDSVACDNRPQRHLAGAPADHATGEAVYAGLVLESDDVEKIYGVEWESLYTTTGSDGVGAKLKAAVGAWKTDGARGVVLDHRTGYGGTSLGPKPIWDFAVPKFKADRYVDRRGDLDEQPSLEEALALFDEGVSTGDVESIGSSQPTTSVPVALLITEDVSASDWLPFGLKGAPNARIFGPYETNGAFSTRYSFGYWLGMGYVIATGDTVAYDGRMLNGTGIAPDVVVLPKQSDLLVGKDSVYEAALAWVRQELAP